nr:integrase, catalytic region, zinc finger, CCHC-type, peptidase aspartic, catalytic [Tanacetum cinerariifolium]
MFKRRSGLIYCSGGLSGKYTVLAACQIVHCASGLLFLTTICLIRQSGLQVLKTSSHSDLGNKPLPISFLGSGLVLYLHSGLPTLLSSGLPLSSSSGPTLPHGNNVFDCTVEEKRMGLTYLSQLMKDHSRWEHLGKHLPKVKKNKGETIHDYYVWFSKLINNMRNIKMTMSRMQLNSKFVNNMLSEWDRFITAVKLNRGLRNSNYDQLPHSKEVHSAQVTTKIRILQRQDVADANECDVFDSDVDEAPTAQTMFMANLSSTNHVYDEASPFYDLDILSEVHNHDNYQDAVCEHHEVHEMDDHVQPNCVVNSNDEYTSDSNMIPYA